MTSARERVPPPDAPPGPLRFGASTYTKSFFFKGRVAAYQEGFTPPYPLPDDEPGTVVVWQFSEGNGARTTEVRQRPGMEATLTTGLSAVKWVADCARP